MLEGVALPRGSDEFRKTFFKSDKYFKNTYLDCFLIKWKECQVTTRYKVDALKTQMT